MSKTTKLLAAAALLARVAVAEAAPAAPTFLAPVKIGEGVIGSRNNQIAVDGTTVYAAYGTETAAYANSNGRIQDAVRLVKSTNGGATWGRSTVLEASDFLGFPTSFKAVDQFSTQVAVSDDPLYAGRKLVHCIWRTWSSDGADRLNYSYLANRPDQTGWSPPVAINGASAPQNHGALAVTAGGAVHVVFESNSPDLGVFYVTAPSPGAAFSAPVAIDSGFSNTAPVVTTDSSGNVYVAYTYEYQELRLTKKAAGATAWTAPAVVFRGDLSEDISLAVLGPSSYFILAVGGPTSGLHLLTTTNAGGSWTQRTLLASYPEGQWTRQALAVAPTRAVTVAAPTMDANLNSTGVKVWRSGDGGATWSVPATLKARHDPRIALDALNKAYILVGDEPGGVDGGSNLLVFKEK